MGHVQGAKDLLCDKIDKTHAGNPFDDELSKGKAVVAVGRKFSRSEFEVLWQELF